MKNYKIGTVVGSLRKDSINKKLAKLLWGFASKEFSFSEIHIGELPLYNQDEDDNPSNIVKGFKAAIKECDAVLFVCPEYNRSIPGVLKNALDHGSRPYGQSVWAKKPGGIIGASMGSIGTAIAQQHLRTILTHLDMQTLNQPEAFIHFKEGFLDEKGQPSPSSEKFLRTWMNAYVEHVKKCLG